GTLLHERYRIEKELGAGGFGEVYQARDCKLRDVPVAIKLLSKYAMAASGHEWLKRKFKDEIAALTRLEENPHIVRALDVGELADGRIYFVMQFVPGVSLRSEIPPEGMGLMRAAELIRQIASALRFAHDHK